MKNLSSLIFYLVGAGFIAAFFFTDPESKTDDGYSLRYFFLIMGLWFIGLQVIMKLFFAWRFKRRQSQINYYKSHGRKATATILEYSEAGVKVNNVPQYSIKLSVKNIFGKEFITTDKKFLSISEIHKLKPGLEIPALTHPEKQEKALILWEEAGIYSSI